MTLAVGRGDRQHTDWLVHFLAANWKLSREVFEKKLKEPNTAVLLDGLDESPTLETRQETVKLIELAADAYPACRFVVTTRPRAGVQLFQTVRIAPLSKEARTKFLHDWTRYLFLNKAPAAAAAQRDEMLEALERPDIGKMAENPLMLTALAVLSFNNQKLPEQRAKLYEAVIEWLAKSRAGATGKVSPQDCITYLGELAFGMQAQTKGRLESLPRADAADLITSLRPEDAKAFLVREEVDSGIIVSDGDTVKFWHLTFQEFLAARHIKVELDESGAEWTLSTSQR